LAAHFLKCFLAQLTSVSSQPQSLIECSIGDVFYEWFYVANPENIANGTVELNPFRHDDFAVLISDLERLARIEEGPWSDLVPIKSNPLILDKLLYQREKSSSHRLWMTAHSLFCNFIG